jgi:hypothetical protein
VRPLSDNDLLRRLAHEVHRGRRAEADVAALIAEVDARRLYAREACSSMFAYCTQVLHLAEHEAYLRIAVARASREHPVLLDMLRDGRLHLASIAKLAPHLTLENREAVLRRAVHRSKLQVEELVAELIPRPDVPPVVRRLPVRVGTTRPSPPPSVAAAPVDTPAAPGPDLGQQVAPELGPDRAEGRGEDGPPNPPATPARWPVNSPAHRPSLEPLAPARYRVQFTASAELREKLVRLQDLMRATVPDGDLGRIIGEAVAEKLERLEAKRFARTSAPRKSLADADTTPSSRHVPAPVRRAVHQRDGGRCTYRDAKGRRCTARDRLEFHHHRTSYGRGGDHSVENVRLMCRTHNQALAEQEYGKEKMAGFRETGSRPDPRHREGAGGAPGRPPSRDDTARGVDREP